MNDEEESFIGSAHIINNKKAVKLKKKKIFY